MYVDDLNLLIPRSQLDQALTDVRVELNNIGLQINDAKTRVLNKDPFETSSVPRSNFYVDQFVLLGADLAETQSYIDDKIKSQVAYFDLLQSLPLHPQLAFTLLKVCGLPRCKYACSVMRPSLTKRLAETFDSKVKAFVSSMIDPSGASTILDAIMHDRLGAGIPAYARNVEIIYNAAKQESLSGVETNVELVTNDIPHPTAQHNLDSDWLYYKGKLTPAEFIAAFGVRVGNLPKHLRMSPCTCACGNVIRTDSEQIEHTFACDRFTHYGHVPRHNRVRDTIIQVANAFALTCTKEPTCYDYTSNKKRPDVLIHTETGIAIDVSIVSPKNVPGEQLQLAEKLKINEHHTAVTNRQHVFHPVVFEVFGLFGKSVTSFITQAARYLPVNLQQDFKREMRCSIANALAAGRASALVGTKWKTEGFSTT